MECWYVFEDLVIPNQITYSAKTYRVTSIGDYAFTYSDGLISVTIPEGVTSIGREAFQSCISLVSVTWNAKKCNSWNFGSQVESFTFGNEVEVIPASLCSGMTKLTSITIPNSVASIGEEAFCRCSSLTTIDIPNSVTSIGNWAFAGCSSLTSVTIPNSVTSIGRSAFSGCSGLPVIDNLRYADTYLVEAVDRTRSTYTIKDGTKWIGNSAFYDCSSLSSITIPNSVASIGGSAFYRCSSLTSVTIPNSVTSIGGNAFYYCSGLTSVTIGNSVTSIGDEAFSGCTSLSSLTIPNSVTSIGENAFSWCTSLSSLTIGGNVTIPANTEFWGNIIKASFNGCSINEIHFIGSLNDWLNKLWNPSQISSNYALYIGDTLLSSVIFSSETTSIADYAFDGCNSLESVVLSGAVKTIGDLAFNCPNIKSITCYSMRPPSVHQNGSKYTSFPEDMPYSTIIYVPANYKNTYMVHDFWGMYDVRPIGAATTETTSVQVTPGETTATIAWPTVNGAETYEMVIKDKQGNVICTLIFNSNGQLTEIAFNAPSRYGEVEQTQASGFSFTVTGLEEGTAYDLTITSKDSNGATLDKKTIAFNTTGGVGVENTQSDGLRSTKVLRDGKVFILRGDKTYIVQGQEVK